MAYQRPLRNSCGDARDLGIGHAKQHSIDPGDLLPTPEWPSDGDPGLRKRSGEGVSEAAPADDGQGCGRKGVEGEIPFQFPHLEIPVGVVLLRQSVGRSVPGG